MAWYKIYVLGVVSIGYTLAELGHYLIGITSRETAKDIQYGDYACLLNLQKNYTIHNVPGRMCDEATTPIECANLTTVGGDSYCEWDRNGLGLDYQILAGPSFMVVLTVVGVGLGILGDKFNRVRMLALCTLVFSMAFVLMGACTRYWHMLVLRMLLAAGEAGCNPMATGILSDIFPEKKRGLVMAVFNWGIYGGYGIAFPVGHYITRSNLWELGWRLCYYLGGAVSLGAAALTATLREPERQMIGEEKELRDRGAVGKEGLAAGRAWWQVLSEPRIVLLCVAASFRNAGGACFAYNCDLYYRHYFPGEDLAWYLFFIFSISGSVGVVVGGLVSDKYVKTHGARARVAVLAVSQLCATPFAFGSVYFGPYWAMMSLGVSFFFAEMWFGSLFAVMVEIVPLSVRSTTVGVFLFVMNNMAGVLPIVVEPVSKAIGYRESLYIFYVGFYFISSVLFFANMYMMDGKTRQPQDLHLAQLKQAHDNPALSPESPNNSVLSIPSSLQGSVCKALSRNSTVHSGDNSRL